MGEQCVGKTEAPFDECACVVCGDDIDIESWHPILADTDATGTFRLYPFCTTDCRDAWNSHRTNR
ncbi:hypothetical protein ZOD2009_19418 [Haladaptatus paucihalophilus DX253]|uniref:Uncharacterized protein n=1 Tax=Haladaptatus paucihalophilus DX253 TaxID=797209 RepID=E7QYJ3_HALPU|nr:MULTISPECIES: hypothetical protein [Haladaptatus]EFW90259.1 hypothetical protein ZOD2009_19418 [Haladaptatus paucihalophilus DX253]GKZ12221.1 hypothetical protein HAL_01020 [Haladaptatus sp. T7]SHJ99481.1 hypothetical protein SAMN05444342_0208 [Haladaptatus paucihalophilus DX253]